MRLTVCTHGLARHRDDGTAEVLDLPAGDVGQLLRAHGQRWREVVDTAAVRDVVDLDTIVPVSPVDGCSAVWGVGLNYWSRAEASGREPTGEPTIFLRGSSTGAATGQDVQLPKVARQVDYEGELAVIVGADCDGVDQRDVWSRVALLAPANDMTARDVMRRTGVPALAKSYPGFGPIGSTLATPDAFTDPDDLEVCTFVNGEPRQRDRTSGMVHSVGAVVAIISSYVVLRAGDVILTGSPAGTGDETGTYLSSGDTIEVSIEDLPAVVTTITDEPGRAQA